MTRLFLNSLNSQVSFFNEQKKCNLPEIKNRNIFHKFFNKKFDKEDPFNFLQKYFIDLNKTFDLLNDSPSKKLYSELIIFRALWDKMDVKLSSESVDRINRIAEIGKHKKNTEVIDVGHKGIKIEGYDLSFMGFPIKIFSNPEGIYIIFEDIQYEYSRGGKSIFVKKGDTVLDLGGCWGDSCLFFSDRVGDTGKVYVFEFIPKNLGIFSKNLEANPSHAKRIRIIERPVWNKSDVKIYFLDRGPASVVFLDKPQKYSGETVTVSIDDFIRQEEVAKVDFIKMDIEGAELKALEGAVNTLRKYRPNLAISIYHNWEQFSRIAPWLNELNLGYKFYLGHYNTGAWETVLYAATE